MRGSSLGERARLLIGIALAALGLAGCGSAAVDSGGLTAHDRTAAQSAMDDAAELEHLAAARDDHPLGPERAGHVPDPPGVEAPGGRTTVYVFWIPFLAAEPYVWLTMKVTGDPKTSTFHLGTSDRCSFRAAG